MRSGDKHFYPRAQGWHQNWTSWDEWHEHLRRNGQLHHKDRPPPLFVPTHSSYRIGTPHIAVSVWRTNFWEVADAA